VALKSTFTRMLDELPDEPRPDGQPVDFRDCFGPVRNQGQRGTCVGHAGAAVMERAHFLATGHPISFSPQFLFHSAKMSDGAPTVDGTWSRVAMPTLLNDGICWEAHWPYVATVIPGDIHHGPPPQAALDAAAKHTAIEVIELDPRDSAGIRSELAVGHAVTVSVPVYENWYGPMTRSFGKIPMPLPNSAMLGGHALCAVGYDFDAEFTGGGYFVLRNSWGSRWAASSPIEPGYGAIPFEYVDRYGWEAFSVRH
jgi:C1A family cysteine protease